MRFVKRLSMFFAVAVVTVASTVHGQSARSMEWLRAGSGNVSGRVEVPQQWKVLGGSADVGRLAPAVATTGKGPTTIGLTPFGYGRSR
jgi:hypothetical protein